MIWILLNPFDETTLPNNEDLLTACVRYLNRDQAIIENFLLFWTTGKWLQRFNNLQDLNIFSTKWAFTLEIPLYMKLMVPLWLVLIMDFWCIWKKQFRTFLGSTAIGQFVECSVMVRESGVQSQVESYLGLKKWYFMPPCLTLSIIRSGSRVKWSNPGNGVAPFPTHQCSSYWKGSLWVILDWEGCQLTILI